MNRPVHFELHSVDPARTNAFFERVFGWKMTRWGGGGGDVGGAPEYFVASTGGGAHASGGSWPGIDGGVMRSRDGQQRTVNTIQVDDVDRCAAEVKGAGGKICVEKMAISGVGYLMYATDPTGVLFGFMHADPGAK